MKIAFVLGSLDVGGTETQVCRLAAELSAQGHEVIVLVLANGGPLAKQLDEALVPWKSFGFAGISFRNAQGKLRPWVMLEELAKALNLYRSMKAFRPQVCHAFLYWAYVISLPIAAAARVPVRLGGRRGITRPRRRRLIFLALEKISNLFAHAITANAEAVAEDVAEHESVDRSRIHIIRNGVDIPPDPAPVGTQPPVGLIVANLIWYKGHIDLIEALALLDHPPVVRSIGEGPERATIEAEIERAGLHSVLVLEGHVPKASLLWRDVQFGILSSHEEGLPNAAMEAMAAGVPMIATHVGGVSEIIKDGVTGILVPPKDPVAMSQAIARLAADAVLRQELGNRARLEAAKHSWPSCIEQHLSLYRKLGAEATSH